MTFGFLGQCTYSIGGFSVYLKVKPHIFE